MCFYMANLSIDVADIQGTFDPSVNEIESMVEFVYEIVLDQKNLMPEHDEPDPESEIYFLNLDFNIADNSLSISPLVFCVKDSFSGYGANLFNNPHLRIVLPPPKA